MDQRLIVVILCILGTTLFVKGQLNGVKPLLIPCYNVSAIPGIIIADNRPPMNLNIFLELLRRLEDANPTLTAREFSSLILQRLWQNGITSTGGNIDLNISIPFTPYGLEAYKGTLILQQYLPNSAQTFYYGDLQQADLCALHYMISDTINNTVRGDESVTCVRSAQYQARFRRGLEGSEESVGDDGNADTESVLHLTPRRLAINPTTVSSQCPVELGVLYTNHGTVKIGDVLSGLATALNQENVKGSDNRYAATLAGNLAHAALSQGISSVQVGSSGGWNSTINPKYFFLQRNSYLDFTDQDIRGSVDGILLALQLERSIKKKYSDVKLSQIIDMYYSPEQRGVFDSTFRACNRNILYSEFVSGDTLSTEVASIIKELDNSGQYPYTTNPDKYQLLVDGAVNSFAKYFPSINDLACPQVDSPTERVSTDLLIFLDPNWSFTPIQSIISYILDNIDVNKYGSRYTLFSGADATNLTNSTSHLLEFHKAYNLSIHEKLNKQFDYSKIYEVMETIVRGKLNNNTYTGGESTIVLLVTRTPPNESHKNFLEQRKEIIKQLLPDVTVMVLGSGTPGEFSSILLNPSKDFIPLSDTTNENDLKSTAKNVIDRIKTIPRSIVNPNCAYGFTGSTSTFSTTQYVDLNSVNYYKIVPNYFFKGDGPRILKITETSTGSITVCISRNQSRPDSLSANCKTIQLNVQTTDISDWCGSNFEECAPIYLSVYGNTTQYRCKDYFCRYPDSVRYTISLENVGCTSGTYTIIGNFFLIATLFLYLRF